MLIPAQCSDCDRTVRRFATRAYGSSAASDRPRFLLRRLPRESFHGQQRCVAPPYNIIRSTGAGLNNEATGLTGKGCGSCDLDFHWLHRPKKSGRVSRNDGNGISILFFDILPALKGGDSYGAQAAFAWFASVGSCCWRHYRAAHFTGEPGVSRP